MKVGNEALVEIWCLQKERQSKSKKSLGTEGKLVCEEKMFERLNTEKNDHKLTVTVPSKTFLSYYASALVYVLTKMLSTLQRT